LSRFIIESAPVLVGITELQGSGSRLQAEALFARAAVLHQQGRLLEAKAGYEKILQISPLHFGAQHFLGVVAFQMGSPEQAVELIGEAIKLNPSEPAAYVNRGLGLIVLEKHDEALDDFDRAIALKPDYVAAHQNRAISLHELKRYGEALAGFDKAIHFRPDNAQAHYNKGRTFGELNQFEEALQCLDRAISLQPGYAEAYSNRGNALVKLDRHEDALASYDKALALKPDNAEAYFNRGNVLAKLNCQNDALASYDKALSLKPDNPEAHYNRGIALAELDRPDDAIASFGTAISLKPDNAEAYYHRGNALREIGRFDDAIASYDRAISLKPDYSEALLNEACTLLLQGKFEPGFNLFENRGSLSDTQKDRNYPQPIWLKNQNLSGKSVLVYHELFLGDMMQFCRYAKLMETEGAKVYLSAQNCLHDLLKSLSPAIELIAEKSQPPAFDYHVSLLSLPLAFKTTEKAIPAQVPYLHADNDRIENWKRKIGGRGFKIGICWQGSKQSTNNGRSFPLSEFCNISQFPGVRLISLQKNDGLEQLAEMPDGMKVETLGDDFDAGAQAFLDTAAVMKNLDLVITCDTAIAHLAGALAIPTWIVLRRVPDWRWLLERSDSPWYPTMRLFRQQERRNWRSAFAQMESALALKLGLGA
jgi:tetratricopeptide (TPR) repeat protein